MVESFLSSFGKSLLTLLQRKMNWLKHEHGDRRYMIFAVGLIDGSSEPNDTRKTTHYAVGDDN